MISNVETKNNDSVKHRFKLAQAINWLLNLFNGLQDSSDKQALVSDGNGTLAFEEVITTEGGQTIAGNTTIGGDLIWGSATNSTIRGRIYGEVTTSYLAFGQINNTAYIGSNSSTTDNTTLVIQTANAGVETPAITIDSSQNSTFSGAMDALSLDVTSYVRVPDNASIYVGSANDLRIHHSGAGTFINNTTGSLAYGAPSGSNHYWTINSVERMRIDSSGKVGIGTASPTEKLHVAGKVKISTGGLDVTGLATFNNDAVFGDNKQVFFGASDASLIYHDGTDMKIVSNTGGDIDIVYNSGGGLNIGTGTITVGALPTTDPEVVGQIWNDANTLKISEG